MANLFKNATAWMAGKLKDKVGVAVIYRRGAIEAPITATLSQWVFRKDDPSQGPTLRITTRDFLITAADLEAAGISMPPQRGDEIDETPEGTTEAETYTHRLTPIDGEPFWRWFDSQRRMVRVHTKETGAV